MNFFLLLSHSKMQKLSSDHHHHFGYHGSYYGISETYNCFEIDICPDFLLAGLAASGAAAFFWIYQAITVKAGGRRKRSLQNFITSHDFDHLIDFFTVGKFYILIVNTVTLGVIVNTRECRGLTIGESWVSTVG